MIVYSRLGSKGNFGNQLFQIASTIGIAMRNGQDFGFPEWEYSKYFSMNLPLYDSSIQYESVQEKHFNYSDVLVEERNCDLNGWFQSEKYFHKETVKSYFLFKSEIVSDVKEKYKEVLSKKNILISVRRGDFINHPYYFQLDYKYYFLAITTQFPDWKERSLIFTSDNIAYCKRHFQFLPNAIFVEDSFIIEQIILGSMCDDYVISNSTFSWWQAWLGETETTRIIRPIQNFRDKFRLMNDDKDYFPVRWSSFDSNSEKIGLKYKSLELKGEFFKFVDLMQFNFKLFKKRAKFFFKKIIFYHTWNAH
jgi:hypothetical protein